VAGPNTYASPALGVKRPVMPRTARASSLATQQSMPRASASDRLAALATVRTWPGATSIFSVTLSDARVRGERSPSRRSVRLRHAGSGAGRRVIAGRSVRAWRWFPYFRERALRCLPLPSWRWRRRRDRSGNPPRPRPRMGDRGRIHRLAHPQHRDRLAVKVTTQIDHRLCYRPCYLNIQWLNYLWTIRRALRES
jgi:hypothetical protein